MGVASTAGSLPPEVIRRIMRMQTGRFRMCYQRGLQLDPTLSGRIVVRFTIGPSGSVTSAASAGSTVQNAQVVACVVDAFKRMSFPQPEGGGVTVVSPLAFSPDGASSSPLVAFKGTPFGIGLSQGDDGWMKGSPQHLTALEEAVKREPTSRRRRTELVRAQLAAGRFADAVVSARAFADVDPDGALARELLASALIASGDEAQALWEIQALAELSPTSAVVHPRERASVGVRARRGRESGRGVDAPLGRAARARSPLARFARGGTSRWRWARSGLPHLTVVLARSRPSGAARRAARCARGSLDLRSARRRRGLRPSRLLGERRGRSSCFVSTRTISVCFGT
jgi:TonB family protein